MSDSQMVDRMSDSVLTKLLEVESELEAQEASLLAQVEAIRQQRTSLSAVIHMFTTSEDANPPQQSITAGKPGRKKSKEAVTPEINNLIQSVVAIPDVAEAPVIETNGTAPIATPPEAPAPAEKPKRGRRGAQSNQPAAKSVGKSKASTRGAQAKQSPQAEAAEASSTPKTKPAGKGGRKSSNNWRNYMRPEFGKAPLPEVVSSVLRRQPDGILDVPTIVSTIFMQDTPKEVRNQARDRVLHILSAGVKEKKWYRGKTGQYSLSQAAAESTMS